MTIDADAFIDGYVECALWADCMPHEDHRYNPAPFCSKCGGACRMGNGELGGCEGLELRDGAREKMAVDCLAFIEANEADLLTYCEQRTYDPSQGEVESYAGHDFWLTRSGHGAGFWDRGLGALGERLTEASKAYGSPDDHRPYDCGDGTADC
jgi:hypothetical protein